jgi:prepilin-type N-terminal cleavage/methylation domain-containing protein
MRGFSLLEMLVVLVLMGLAAALVAPSLARTADRAREAGNRDDVRRVLMALPALARQRGHGIRFDAGQAIELSGRSWPEGWQVVAVTPVAIASNGWCATATVLARGAATESTYRLASPDCAVEEHDAQ